MLRNLYRLNRIHSQKYLKRGFFSESSNRFSNQKKLNILFSVGFASFVGFQILNKKKYIKAETNDQDSPLETFVSYVNSAFSQIDELESLLKEIDYKFNNLNLRLSSEIKNAPTERDLSSFDQEWIRLSKLIFNFFEKFHNVEIKVKNINDQKSQMIADSLIDSEIQQKLQKANNFFKSFQSDDKFKIFSILRNNYSEILEKRSQDYPEELTDNLCDPYTLLFYYYTKYKIIQSLRVEQFSEAVKNYHTEFDQDLKNLRSLYREAIEKFEKEMNEPISKHVQENMFHFVRDYTSAFYEQMINSLNYQRKELEADFKLKEELMASEILSSIQKDYIPIIASIHSLKKIVENNNIIIEHVKNQQECLRLAYAIKILLNSNQSNVPLNKHFNKIAKISDDENVKLIISKIPQSALENGIKEEGLLIKELSDLVKKAKKLVFTKNEELGFWIKFVSSFHNLFRIKNRVHVTFPTDPSDDIFGNYDLLDSLDDHINKSDLMSCINAISLLHGNSKHVFDSWLLHSTNTIETKALSDLLLVVLNNKSTVDT